MALLTAKVPAALATGVICLLVGGGLGAAIMSYSQSDPKKAAAAADAGAEEGAKTGGEKAGEKAKGGGGKAGGGFGAKGGGMPGAKGGGGGGQRGPGPKVQLALLVAKLDTLTARPLHIDLTPEEKKQAKELLGGLNEKDELSDEVAAAKLAPLLKLLEGQRKTLEEVGFRWPGATVVAGGGAPPANPFKEGDGAAHLKSLQATLGK